MKLWKTNAIPVKSISQMNITIEQLEDCIIYIAKAIEIRPDGDLYIPIFESLEDEIQKRRSKTDTKSRISMIASRD